MSVRRLATDCPSKKVTFRSRAKANQFIKSQRGRPGALKPYRCPHCKLWHTTSRKRGK